MPGTESVPELELDHNTIDAINQAVGRHNQEMARVHKGAPPGRVGVASNVGAIISNFLPGIVEVLGEIAATKGGVLPTIDEFFAAGHDKFNGGKGAAPAAGPARDEPE